MANLINRLREAASKAPNRDILFEAADEIERLREGLRLAVKAMREAVKDIDNELEQ